MSIFDEAAWEERYRSSHKVWSGLPNPQLVAEVSDLPPGTALDAGCGEGADALWLAERGWRVTATDFSTTALERAVEHAATAGPAVAERIDWVHADLRVWTPPESTFDLVSAHFLHLLPEDRRPLFARLAAAVAPGGTLLIVGHDVSDLQTGAHRPDMPEMFFPADEVAGSLDADGWEVLTAEARPRTSQSRESRDVPVHDAVVTARRLATG